MFIIACVLLNKANLVRANFPTDSQGNVCLLDIDPEDNQKYPFLYFSDIQNPLNNRHCLKDCPLPGKAPECGFGDCNIGIYPSHPDNNRLGSYCMPEDPDLKDIVTANSGLNNHWNLLWAIDYLLLGLLISSVLGFTWMILVQYCPKVMVWAAIFLAIVLLIVTAVIFFVHLNKALS
jgi:hypothetical protein